jgi:hypothetical protein
MPVWPFLMGLSALVLCLAMFAKNAPAMKVAGVIFCAYIAGRAVKMAGDDFQLSAFAIIWLLTALAAVTINPARYGISLLLLGVSACYLWARVASAPWVFGSMPFVVSDVLAVAAMLSIGWGLRHDIIDRIDHLGWHSAGRGFSLGSNRAIVAAQAQAREDGK